MAVKLGSAWTRTVLSAPLGGWLTHLLVFWLGIRLYFFFFSKMHFDSAQNCWHCTWENLRARFLTRLRSSFSTCLSHSLVASCRASFCSILPCTLHNTSAVGLALLVGAVLGPLALLIIFVLLAHGHLEFPGTFKGTGSLWAFSILVSTVSFGLYVALLKGKSRWSSRPGHVSG